MPQIDELDTASALVLRQRANFVAFNTITGNYTLVAGDWGRWIRVNSGSAVVVTVPPESSVAFADGVAIPIVRYGAGTVTVTPGSGVTINSDGEDTLIPSQFKTALLIKVTTNTWLLQGIGATGSSGGDVTPPTVTSATATDANTIVIVFSESVTVTTAGWSFNNGGALTINGVSGAGTTWSFDINETMTSSDTITRTYNSGTGATVDGSANELASFTGSSVTNSIAGPSIIFQTDFAGAADAAVVALEGTLIGETNMVVDGSGNSKWTSGAAWLAWTSLAETRTKVKFGGVPTVPGSDYETRIYHRTNAAHTTGLYFSLKYDGAGSYVFEIYDLDHSASLYSETNPSGHGFAVNKWLYSVTEAADLTIAVLDTDGTTVLWSHSTGSNPITSSDLQARFLLNNNEFKATDIIDTPL